MPGRQRQTDLCEFKVWLHTPLILALGRQRQEDLDSRIAWSTELFQDKDIQRTCLKKLKVKIQEIEVEIKLHKDGKYTENLDTVCYYTLFELIEC